MAIYEIKSDKISKIEETSFAEASLKERSDLQRLLRKKIDIVAPDVLIISEEFSDWSNSKRRIDLLGLDKDANLVVIELKRNDTGGHMDLQAIRYAGMVSTMTFEKAVEVYKSYLSKIGSDLDARDSMIDFLKWEEPNEDDFAQDVRILLIAAGFSKELTTSVMWLNERGLDIRCVRLQPYNYDSRVLVDIQQIIPLPEAQDYIIEIKEKAEKQRIDRVGRSSGLQLKREFWEDLLVMAKEKTTLFQNISPSEDSFIEKSAGISGIFYMFAVRKHESTIEFCLRGHKENNKAYFDILLKSRKKIDTTFGEKLDWQRCDELKKSYVRKSLTSGGYRNDKKHWPQIHEEMIETMIRLEKSLSPFIEKLKNQK